jgi:hypothetical protein
VAANGGEQQFAVAGEEVPSGVPGLRSRPEEGPPGGDAIQGVLVCLDHLPFYWYGFEFRRPNLLGCSPKMIMEKLFWLVYLLIFKEFFPLFAVKSSEELGGY